MTDKPDLTRIWGEGAPSGNVVDPDTTTPGKFSNGWQAEVPPFEHFNFIQKFQTQGLAHINEQGIAVWDDVTTYPVGGLAKGSDGNVYKALLSQSDNDPVIDSGTNWIDWEVSNRVIRAASVVEIEALTATDGHQVSLSGSEAGVFEFSSSDLSTEVTNDPSQLEYIAPASDSSGASGAWVRRPEYAPKLVDLFVVCGQSNSDGTGDVLESPESPNGYVVGSGGAISYPLTDPVGSANSGSAWPAFANEWFAQTGRQSVISENGVVATGLQEDAGDGEWSPAGTLRALAATAANNAIDSIRLDSTLTLGTVRFVWLQGEKDAVDLNGTTVTGAGYETALKALAAYFKAQVPEMETMCVIQISRLGSGGGNTTLEQAGVINNNYMEIKAAQKRACDTDDLLLMAYTGTYSFPYRLLSDDGRHYRQSGYNEVGRCAAKEINYPQPFRNLSPYLGSENFADVGNDSSQFEKTANYQTKPFTKTLVVVVGSGKNANTGNFTTVVTCNGAPMRFVKGASAETGGRVRNFIYALTEEELGENLRNATVEIKVTTDSQVQFLSLTAISLKDVEIADADHTTIVEGGADTDVSSTITTNQPSFILATGISQGDAASVVTASVTGATEITDDGITNGTHRNSSFFIGYSEQNTPQDDYGIDWVLSADQKNIAIQAVSFRPRIRGEQHNPVI